MPRSIKAKHSPTLCPLPWVSLSTDSQRELRLCCHESRQKRFLENNKKPFELGSRPTVREHLNHSLFKQTRVEMLSGKQPSSCHGCYQLEKETGDSPRTEYLERYRDRIDQLIEMTLPDGTLHSPEVLYLDVTTDNNCNLVCRMCRPRYSEKILDHWREIGWGPKDEETKGISADISKHIYSNSSVMNEVASTVTHVTITGGEPLLSSAAKVLLERLSKSERAPQISLRFFTNTTVYPENLIPTLSAFKEVHFFCSIDGAGKTSDYIRYPSRWGQIALVFDKLVKLSKDYPHQFKVYLHTVIQAYNITQITDLFQFLRSYAGTIPLLPSFTHVESSLPLGVEVLPLNVLQVAQDKIDHFLTTHEKDFKSYHQHFHDREIKRLKSIVKQGILQNESHRFIDFYIYSKKLDKIRGQSLLETYPEFKGSL